jgi:hypothetical protein
VWLLALGIAGVGGVALGFLASQLLRDLLT